jgi:hypothetical protein
MIDPRPASGLRTALYETQAGIADDDPRQGTYLATDMVCTVKEDERSVKLHCAWPELIQDNLTPFSYEADWTLPVMEETPSYVTESLNHLLIALDVLQDDVTHRIVPYTDLGEARQAAHRLAEKCTGAVCRLTLTRDTTGQFLVAFVHKRPKPVPQEQA